MGLELKRHFVWALIHAQICMHRECNDIYCVLDEVFSSK